MGKPKIDNRNIQFAERIFNRINGKRNGMFFIDKHPIFHIRKAVIAFKKGCAFFFFSKIGNYRITGSNSALMEQYFQLTRCCFIGVSLLHITKYPILWGAIPWYGRPYRNYSAHCF